jgi:hypothetical protein
MSRVILIRSMVASLATGFIVGLGSVPTLAKCSDTDPTSDRSVELARMTTDHLDLTGSAVTTRVAPKASKKDEKLQSLLKAVNGLTGEKKLYLIVRNLTTNIQPGVLYSVYLNLPPNASADVAAKHRIGTINFFNATGQKSDKFVSFDITSMLKALAKAGELEDEVKVTVIPDGAPTPDSKPRIGELNIVER